MAYQPNIPNANDLLRNSQSDIQGNFQSISTAFDQNHADFNSATAGQHYVVQMPVQANEPVPPGGYANTDIALYNEVSAVTGIPELWVKPSQNNPTLADYPVTASVLSYSTPAGISSGWTYLPSGMILKWGQATVTNPGTSTTFTVVYPVSANIPVFDSVFQVMLTPVMQDAAGGNAAWSVSVLPGTQTTTQFQFRCGTSSAFFAPVSAAVAFLAIGY